MGSDASSCCIDQLRAAAGGGCQLLLPLFQLFDTSALHGRFTRYERKQSQQEELQGSQTLIGISFGFDIISARLPRSLNTKPNLGSTSFRLDMMLPVKKGRALLLPWNRCLQASESGEAEWGWLEGRL